MNTIFLRKIVTPSFGRCEPIKSPRGVPCKLSPPHTCPPPFGRFPRNSALLASWASGDACADHWIIVQCEGGSITGLDLWSGNLQGTLPSELGALTALRSINLQSLPLMSGTVPSSIGLLTDLTRISLSNNRLSGTLPSELFSLKKLEIFELFSNSIRGTLSSQIGALTNLHDFGVSGLMSGPLPTTLGLLTSMGLLQLGNNRFDGSIPSEIARLTNLNILQLAGNFLSGEIPSSLGNLTTLRERLSLHSNRLSGTLPSSLGFLTALTNFDVNNNPCVYGPLARIGNVGTTYDISGTALGTWSVPAACSLTLPPAPPPAPPSPPSPPPPPPPPAANNGDQATMLALRDSWCVEFGG